MAKFKPSIDNILKQFEKNKTIYGTLWSDYEKDEMMYELNFKDLLQIADDFKEDRVCVPTARDVVDAAINHTDIMNARVFVNKKNTSEVSSESAEMLRKLALGLIHRTNVESSIAPGRVGAKHFWLYGLACYKTVWDADRWLDKPIQKTGESEDVYAARIDEWRSDTHLSLPISITPINPRHIMPDPDTGGELYVMEYHMRSVYGIKMNWPHWTNPLNRKDEDEGEYLSYWDNTYRCDLIDGAPILKIKGGVVKHGYGFIPYTLIESGLGNMSRDAKPEMRYVGLLRKIYDMIISESTNYTLCDIKMKREIMKGGYVTGADAETVGEVSQKYGVYTVVGDKDVEFHDWDSNLAPDAAYMHLNVTKDYIAGHAAPRSVRGLSETGVRSGADRRLVLAEAAAIYKYSSPAFAHGWANILNKCARLAKNVIPGDFQIWAKTPMDEFDVVIKKDKLKEPFNYYVEFAPISEEDEYRRHDDLIRRKQAGLIDDEYAWERQNDVDPKAMQRRMKKAQLRTSPAYLQSQDQFMAMLAQQAFQAAGIQMPLQLGAGEQTAGGGTAEGMPRRNVSPIPDRAGLGTMDDLQNQWDAARANIPKGVQGQGGGGNRG